MPHDKVLKAKQALMSDLNLKKIYPPEIQGMTLFEMYFWTSFLKLKLIFMHFISGLDIVEKFLKYVQKLEFKQTPSYSHCRDILRKGLPSSWKGSLFLEDPGAGAVVKNSKSSSKRMNPGGDEVDSIAKKICVPQVEEEEEGPKRYTLILIFMNC